MFWNRKQKVFQEFRSNIGFYPHAYVISYFPPSQSFTIREEVNFKSVCEMRIVLLEIVLPSSCKLYRCQDEGIIKDIECASIAQEWESIFQRIHADINREIDRKFLNWKF